jgi:septal ring factor EnvC (AmiA/AmiB activator)
MRGYVFALFSLCAVLFGASVEHVSDSTARKFRQTEQQIKKVRLELGQIAKDIKKLQREIEALEKKIAKVDARVRVLSKEHEQRVELLERAKIDIERLTRRHRDLEKRLNEAISKRFALSILLNATGEAQEEDIITQEVLRFAYQQEKERLKGVAREYSVVSRQLEREKRKLHTLQKKIEALLRQRSKLQKLKEEKRLKVAALEKKRRQYDAQLKHLLEQRKVLRSTLERLEIVTPPPPASKKEPQNSLKVKHYGKYRLGRTVHYRGPKTIPPLERFRVVRRYGVYKDPVYDMVIANENVVLKPLEPNAKVRSVLNGEVVLVKRFPHIKHMVIIKHPGNLHTIYANIDTISPFLKEGMRVKKGYILGRVNEKLLFEVTKNKAHIDPLELIRVR